MTDAFGVRSDGRYLGLVTGPDPRHQPRHRPPRYEWHYLPEGGGGFEPYDHENPPDEVAETTTEEAHTSPYIVREEIGVIVRDEYRIAVLFDPEQP